MGDDLAPVRAAKYAGSVVLTAAVFAVGLWVVGVALLVSYAQDHEW